MKEGASCMYSEVLPKVVLCRYVPSIDTIKISELAYLSVLAQFLEVSNRNLLLQKTFV